MRNKLVSISVFLFAASIVLLAYGVHLKTTAQNFSAYEQQMMNEIIKNNPGKDLAPGIGIGLALANAWPFVACVHFVLFVGFNLCIYCLRRLKGKSKPIYLLLIGFIIFTAICLWGVYVNVASAAVDFRWGYFVITIAEVLLSIALSLAVIGIYNELFNKQLQPTAFSGG